MRCSVHALTFAFALGGVVLLVGCQPATNSSAPTPTTTASSDLDKLSPEDRAIADAQGYCAVETENRLGSMGVPIKVMVNDQPVFVCCKGCEEQALADPAATLARVEELKAKVAAEKASAQ